MIYKTDEEIKKDIDLKPIFDDFEKWKPETMHTIRYSTSFKTYLKQLLADLILSTRRSDLLAVREMIEGMKQDAVENDNAYPDARWARENYGAKEVNRVLKKILSQLPVETQNKEDE